jgi:cytochrome c556
MLKPKRFLLVLFMYMSMCGSMCGAAAPEGDTREPVSLPQPMQQHMLANMRDHLAAIDEILSRLAAGQPDQAAEIAETRLGMSALEAHGASHMAKFMPEGMRKAGTRMHRAASRFALQAQAEEDAPTVYRALGEVTAACVACHAGYRLH